MMKPIVNILYIFLACLAAAAFAGCSGDDEPSLPAPPEPQTAHRTVLVYMVANNNLSSFASDDIDEMKAGVTCQGALADGRWLVYYSGPDMRPRLLELLADGTERELKVYDAAVSSVSIERMRQEVADARALAPADGLGLVLWSHGTGWISDSGSIDEPSSSAAMASPLSFGMDGNRRLSMKIPSLRRALEGGTFDFIYFDCCHMATVEVAYELRHVTPRIVASPTELGVEGMPYALNVSPLMSAQPDLAGALGNTFAYYERQLEADDPFNPGYGCCISLLNTAALDDLADATRAIYLAGAATPAGYDAVPYFRRGITSGIYDMRHHIRAVCPDPDLLARWEAAFDKVVMTTRSTPKVYFLPADDFAGLGHNVIRTEADTSNGYTETQWWADVASHIVF